MNKRQRKGTVYVAEGPAQAGYFRVVTLAGDVLMTGLTGHVGAANWGTSNGFLVLSQDEIRALCRGEEFTLRDGKLRKRV